MSKKKSASNKQRRIVQQKKAKQQQMRQLTLYTLVFVVAAGLGIWFMWIQANPTSDPVAQDQFKLAQQPSRGSADAPVKVVEFGDFKCPACKAFHQDVYPRLVSEFVWQNQVEFFFINYQFLGPDSTTSGIAGECIYAQDESAFWEFYDYIYEHQGPESRVWATKEWVMNVVTEEIPGLNETVLDQCIENREFEDRVKDDLRIGQSSGVTGTPSVFVNGQKVSNWSYNSLRQVILQELENTDS